MLKDVTMQRADHLQQLTPLVRLPFKHSPSILTDTRELGMRQFLLLE